MYGSIDVDCDRCEKEKQAPPDCFSNPWEPLFRALQECVEYGEKWDGLDGYTCQEALQHVLRHSKVLSKEWQRYLIPDEVWFPKQL